MENDKYLKQEAEAFPTSKFQLSMETKLGAYDFWFVLNLKMKFDENA